MIRIRPLLLRSNRRWLSTLPPNIPATDTSRNEKTHFGFLDVPLAEKEERVSQVFHSVASNYDLMNDLMSGGIHRFWKHQFIQQLSPTSDTQLIDLAGGTGDIAFRFIEKCRQLSKDSGSYKAHVKVVDINPSMLQVGQQRSRQQGHSDTEISWQCANAESLPFEDSSFDAYTIAFGIRNCTNIPQVLKEAHRVLKPGGRFMCLEFGKVNNPLISQVYDGFSFNVIPQMGQLMAGDRNSYQYLVESIRKFPAQPVFAQMIRDAGFKMVEWNDLTFGVASIHSGWKDVS